MIALGSAGTHAAETKTAIFAGGCFWCMEAAFDEVDGVTETISGYAGGTQPNPTYGNHEGYKEAVKVTYDPAKVTYATLLDHYWHNIDPFDPDGQFCDKGSAYQSVIFTDDDSEKTLGREDQAGDRRSLQAEGRDRDRSGHDLYRGGGLPPGLPQPESGLLQVLQMGLRSRATARADLGQAVVMLIPKQSGKNCLSFPALCRASTIFDRARVEDVDGRDKSGHDEG